MFQLFVNGSAIKASRLKFNSVGFSINEIVDK